MAGIVVRVNQHLQGKELNSIEPILKRLGRGGELPHWYVQLRKKGTLPNLDGKTVGSVIEMLLVADIEKNVLKGKYASRLLISPAKGVDVPDLDLGIKSPSQNWCTSASFLNAYERLLGTAYDALAVITNYQKVKDKPPLKIQLTNHHYFRGHEIADSGLCVRAKRIRKTVLQFDDARAKKVFKFLAFAVQSEWLCKRLLELISNLDTPAELPAILDEAIAKFDTDNATALKNDKPGRPVEDRAVLADVRKSNRFEHAIVEAADNWVVNKWQEAARLPNEDEWVRLQRAPFEGKLGVSFALQWRYNFGVYFNGLDNENT